ncbi:hypothetical protein, partial [Klebsiella pneumoniae]
FDTLGAYIDDVATKTFNGVSLFSNSSLSVTTNEDGGAFSMSGVDLASSTYTAATAGSISTVSGASSALTTVKAAITQLAT